MIEPFDMRKIQREHNIDTAFALGGYTVLSIVLWVVSYGIVAYVVYYPQWRFGYRDTFGWENVIIWAVLGVVLVVGLSYRGRLFDSGDYSRGFPGGVLGSRTPGRSLRVGSFGTAVWYIATQILLAAPRTTMLAVRAGRSFISMETDEIVRATKLLDEIGEHREWTPAESYGRVETMRKLVKMDVVWDKEEEGKKVVHVSMTIQARYFP
jgi:hypothetical protein